MTGAASGARRTESVGSMNEFHKRIYVAGHGGMVGSAIVRCLQSRGYVNILTRSHAELELTDQAQVRAFFAKERPDEVYVAAAKVGGIHANNTYPAEFIYSNLMVRGEPDPRVVAYQGQQVAVPGFQLHLSATGSPADVRGCAADRQARADQRAVRRGQDRGHQAVRKLQPPVRMRLPQRHAHQPLRAGRQLSPGEQPRAAGA